MKAILIILLTQSGTVSTPTILYYPSLEACEAHKSFVVDALRFAMTDPGIQPKLQAKIVARCSAMREF